MFAHSEDPDQTPHSDLGLHCLPMSLKWDAMLISGANTWGYLSRGWSTEYPFVIIHQYVRLRLLCKPGTTPLSKMASKTAANYRNDPWNNNACPKQILSINFVFKPHYQC